MKTHKIYKDNTLKHTTSPGEDWGIWLHKNQPHSIDYALKDGGWEVREQLNPADFPEWYKAPEESELVFATVGFGNSPSNRQWISMEDLKGMFPPR